MRAAQPHIPCCKKRLHVKPIKANAQVKNNYAKSSTRVHPTLLYWCNRRRESSELLKVKRLHPTMLYCELWKVKRLRQQCCTARIPSGVSSPLPPIGQKIRSRCCGANCPQPPDSGPPAPRLKCGPMMIMIMSWGVPVGSRLRFCSARPPLIECRHLSRDSALVWDT